MDSSGIIRQMPVSIEAEQALLGSILIKPECFDHVGGMISSDDFYLEEHKHIYSALLRMYSQSKMIDTVTLVNALVEQGDRDEAGGIQYITLIAESVPSAANVKDYARIVKDKATLRRLIGICDEINRDAYEEASPVRTIIDSAEQKIFDISNNSDVKEFRHIRDILQNVYRDIETTVEMKGAVTGAKTGFSGLDRMLVQMGKGDLVIVGARPGMGKTSFALNIGTNVALQTGKNVCMFSLEMSAEQLVTRIISSEAMIDSYALRTGKLDNKNWQDIAATTTKLAGCNILIDDTAGITVTGMKAKLRRVQNLGLVVVDYLQLMQSDKRTDNRVQEVGDISRGLKLMAKELNVPVICCAQLSRGPESRTDKRPMLSDLRDSGAIEQDADTVIFLYRDEYYDNKNAKDEVGRAEVIVAKNRHGSLGNIQVGWIGQYTKFITIDANRSEE
jgi:replicative DNA helicase